MHDSGAHPQVPFLDPIPQNHDSGSPKEGGTRTRDKLFIHYTKNIETKREMLFIGTYSVTETAVLSRRDVLHRVCSCKYTSRAKRKMKRK